MKSSVAISETANDKVGSTGTQDVDSPSARISKKPGQDGIEIRISCEAELFRKQIGAQDAEFLDGILRDLIAACTDGDGAVDERRFNSFLSIIRGAQPRDQIECLIALQTATLHSATMKFYRYFIKAHTIEEINCLGAAYLKSARTFATMTDALRQRQSGANQAVTVQNVLVGDGGQAIVGDVTQKAKDQPANVPASTASADTQALIDPREQHNGASAECGSRPN